MIKKENEVLLTDEKREEKKVYTIPLLPGMQAFIAMVVIIGCCLFFWFVVSRSFDEKIKDIVIYILGVLSSQMSMVISYYFGSSKSSQDKNKALQNLSEKG